MSETDLPCEGNRLNMTQAVINIFNVIVGAGLLVKPYAFAMSGYYGFLAMLMAAMISIYTASILGKVANKYAINIKANQMSNQPLKKMASISQSKTISMTYTNDKIYNEYIPNRINKKQKKQSVYPMLTQLSLHMSEYPKLSIIAANYMRFSVFICQFTIIINFIIINWTLLQDIIHYFISQNENIFLTESSLYIYTSIIM
eukprot:728199_1